MGKIRILDEAVSNIIAAGEVVENPASMVKELLENSLDAGSKNIKIEIKNGGRDVAIIDDGIGMSKDDVLLSIERHATSKISKKDDLYSLFTYGFRGEALSSISAVSKLKLISKTEGESLATQINVLGGKVTNLKDTQRNRGTTIEIAELFYNTPARLKFLRKRATEYANIKDIVMQEAMSNSNVAITLVLDGKISIKTSGNGIDNVIVEIFGGNTLKNLKKFSLGYLGNGALYRSTKDSIFTFVNGRMVKSPLVERVVIDGYYTKLMKGRYPFAIVFLEVDPKTIDVNVHPSKKIIKFDDEEKIYSYVLGEIEKAFERDDDFVSPTLREKMEKEERGDTKQKTKFLDFSDFENFVPLKTTPQTFEELDFYEGEKIAPKEERRYFSNWINEDKRDDFIVGEDRVSYISEDEKESDTNLEIYDEKTEDKNICDKKIDKKESEKENRKQDFRVIGQVFDTFILVERDGIFEIYDQHIVHERILYEKLKNIYSGSDMSVQQLLVPIRIAVDPRERDIILENKASFLKAGFEVDIFSDTDILIRSVPMLDLKESVENIFRDIVDRVKENKNLDLRENILISMSCKGAVKANERLTHEEMRSIVQKLHQIGEYTCPHGRPIITKITRDDLEKLFKRK